MMFALFQCLELEQTLEYNPQNCGAASPYRARATVAADERDAAQRAAEINQRAAENDQRMAEEIQKG